MPDSYRALQTALSNGWILDSWDDDTAAGLNALAAWLCSSGSINDNWVPTFVVNSDAEVELLKAAARAANVWLIETRDDPDCSPEWQPLEDASVLGRVLYTWTDVQGFKKADVVQFPQYLSFAPEKVARDFCRLYARQRATVRDDRDGALQIQKARSEHYRRQFISVLSRVIDADGIRGDTWPIHIRGDAVDELLQPPAFVE